MQDLPDGIFIKAGVLAFIGKMIWDVIFDKYKKYNEGVEKTTQAMNALNLSINELRVEVKWLREMAGEVPTIRRDLNNIGHKLRKMETSS